MHPLLANLVLTLHFAMVLAIVTGFVAIPLGAWAGWHWIRNRLLRQAHLGAMVFIALEGVVGVACPLTVLEFALRGSARQSDFVAYWVSRLLYWNLPASFFAGLYLFAAVLALLLWRWIPPAAPARARVGNAG